jgi:hypothetical protein
MRCERSTTNYTLLIKLFIHGHDRKLGVLVQLQGDSFAFPDSRFFNVTHW